MADTEVIQDEEMPSIDQPVGTLEANENKTNIEDEKASDQKDILLCDASGSKQDMIVSEKPTASDDTPTTPPVDDLDAEQVEEKEEVFDFSPEHHFEDNDETMEENVVADEEKTHDDEKDTSEMNKDIEDDEEEDDDEEADDPHPSSSDPNVMPQVNVAVLAQRKWQVKVYPLKPADFASGHISKVFKNARESLLYLLSPGRNARGKGEMYISSVNQAVRAVFSLMRLTYIYPDINVEIIKKSNEGSIEEKAYIRFDSKMANLLTVGSFRTGPAAIQSNQMRDPQLRSKGRKRERLIGSVFVKNLPPGTTKDVLRVMFPFAQEINYNPEKFKDCTARLVLKSRNHVIPCLKAFAKIELGGNVLELHPLEKKRTLNDEEDAPEAKYRKKSDDPKKEESVSVKKDEVTSKPDVKSLETKKESTKNAGTKEIKVKTDAKSSDKTRKDMKTGNQKSSLRRGMGNRYGNGKKDNFDQNKVFRPKLVGGQERTARGSGLRRGSGRNDYTSERGDGNKNRQGKGFRDVDRSKGSRSFGRSSRGFAGARRSQMERMDYSMTSQSLGAVGVTPSSANLALNAGATKEMVILQNQLSVAIKNQLAMLNQTQLAVEQAKRGASNLGLGSDLPQTSRLTPKAFGGSSGSSSYNKRLMDQYRRNQTGNGGMDQQYSSRNRSRDKAMRSSRGSARGSSRGSSRGGQAGGYGKRTGALRDQMEDSYYDRSADADHNLSYGSEQYGRSSRDFSFDSRDINSSSYGSSGRSGYGADSGSYSGYY